MSMLTTAKDFELIKNGDSVLIDSRLIAESLGIDHGNLMEGIKKYQSTIESKFGQVPFETGKPQNNANGGGRPTVYALLTEDQALFIGTLSRNTEKVVEFKARLVTSFQNARRSAQVFLKQHHKIDNQLPTTDPNHMLNLHPFLRNFFSKQQVKESV